jgi:hypothetical protein
MCQLVNIPVWEQQRIYRPERARLIANDIAAKLKGGQALTLPGVITVYEMGGDKFGLLDGEPDDESWRCPEGCLFDDGWSRVFRPERCMGLGTTARL